MKMRKFVTKNKKAIAKGMGRLSLMVALNVICAMQPVYAASIVTNGLSTLINIVAAFVSSVGAIITLWGLFEWGNAMQSNDGMMQSMAFKRIGGGIVMTLGPQLYTVLIA